MVAYYACQVAKEILEASGLDADFITSGRLGLAFGSTHGSPTIQRQIYKCFFGQTDAKFASIGAVDYLKSMVRTTAVNITKMFGMQDAMLCGGADEYDTTTVAVFDNLLACSSAFNDTPHITPRPFDAQRDGLVVARCRAVMLEEFEIAKKRGAPILEEIIGFPCNNNGGDLILPNLDGITETIRLGLKDAGIASDIVDFVSAHATGTKMGDVIEAQAIAKVYGDSPVVAGLKSSMGHTMASCDAIETILSLYMMEAGFIAPTLNLNKDR